MGMFQRFRDWFAPGVPPRPAPAVPRGSAGQAGGARNPRLRGHQPWLRPRRQPGRGHLRPAPADDRALTTHGVIALVADGMGGCNGGEVASALACEKIPRIYFASNGPAPAALRASLEAVNGEIYQAAQAQPSLRGMGTTVVAFAITSSHGWLAYVGDSRLYLIRRGQIYRMSEDHSMVFEMVHKGLLTAEEARNHADRNVLSRALGSRPQVEVSCWEEPFPIQPGDRFLLCSDGLHDLVTDEKMLDLGPLRGIGRRHRAPGAHRQREWRLR